MKNCIVTAVDYGKFMGGKKAKEDIIYFLNKDNFDSLELPSYSSNKIKKFCYTHFLMKRDVLKNKVDNFVVQYPLGSTYLFRHFVKIIRKNTNSKIYLIIHDLPSLQLLMDDQNIKSEITNLNSTDGLIVHNDHMKSWLKQNGVKTKMVTLEIFDYRNVQKFYNKKSYEGNVCFPGNLAKSKFLEKEILHHHILDIYGPNPQKEYPLNTIYRGKYSSDLLPIYLQQDFGLIWDGDSLSTCSGRFGNYMKYNNPHKTSLYLSCGIPIIIWDKAAMADFVKKYKVGILVSDLNDLDKLLDSITLKQYLELKNNAKKIGEKIRNGFFVSKAVESMLKQ